MGVTPPFLSRPARAVEGAGAHRPSWKCCGYVGGIVRNVRPVMGPIVVNVLSVKTVPPPVVAEPPVVAAPPPVVAPPAVLALPPPPPPPPPPAPPRAQAAA